MNTSFLVPVFSGSFNTQTELLCNARDLHKALQVGRVFANWIKGRIEEYGFVEGVDFIRLPNLASDLSNSFNRNNSKRGGQNKIEYHLILDMAKELAMVEKTEIGRQVRKYFIQCERERFAGTQNIAASNLNSKTGGYMADVTLTRHQRTQIKRAVVLFIGQTGRTAQEVYKLLYARFGVQSYQDIPARHFDEAMSIIDKETQKGRQCILLDKTCNNNFLLHVENGAMTVFVPSLNSYVVTKI